MHNSTKNKLIFLQQYKTRKFRQWKKRQPDNIVGVRIEKKEKAGKELNVYAFLFYVIKKLPVEALDKKQQIPKYFAVKFPDGKTRKIPTDIIESGEFSFHASLMDSLRNNTAGETGSISLLVGYPGSAYAITNFHVAAFNLMQYNQFYFPKQGGYQPDNLQIGVQPVSLYKGIFSNKLDVALVAVGPVSSSCNDLPGGNQLQKPYVPFSIDPSWRGATVYIFSPSHRNGRAVRLLDNSGDFDPNYNGILMQDMIGLEECTVPGDSGSVVVTSDLRVLGIVIGAFQGITYLVPYWRIFNFHRLPII